MKLVIHTIEDSFGDAGTMIVCPSPDTRVECGDEGGLVTATVGVDEFLQPLQVTLLGFGTGFDERFVAPFAALFACRELADGKTEEVKTGAAFVFMQCVGDVGFAGLESQSDACQPLFGQGAQVEKHGEVFAKDDQVIGETDDGWSVAFGQGGCDDGFEIVQRNICEER